MSTQHFENKFIGFIPIKNENGEIEDYVYVPKTNLIENFNDFTIKVNKIYLSDRGSANQNYSIEISDDLLKAIKFMSDYLIELDARSSFKKYQWVESNDAVVQMRNYKTAADSMLVRQVSEQVMEEYSIIYSYGVEMRGVRGEDKIREKKIKMIVDKDERIMKPSQHFLEIEIKGFVNSFFILSDSFFKQDKQSLQNVFERQASKILSQSDLVKKYNDKIEALQNELKLTKKIMSSAKKVVLKESSYFQNNDVIANKFIENYDRDNFEIVFD